MPTRFQFLRQVWEREINCWMGSKWIDEEIERSKKDPNEAFSESGRALEQLLKLGATREEIGHIARSVAHLTAAGVFLPILEMIATFGG
jgi:hypothetical protein